MGAPSFLPSLLLVFSFLAFPSMAHNITEILSSFPEYSLYNGYLSLTKLDDEINGRQTITCLVLNNDGMSALARKHPLSVIKNALSLLVLLDYYDAKKLHEISNGTAIVTTLYQTTGNADGNLGFLNVTNLRGGRVGFGSAVPGSKLVSTYTKSVKQIPYNISVLEISTPIIPPGLTQPAGVAGSNLTEILGQAGCKRFASLVMSSGVLKIYQSAIESGLTVFAPTDSAFEAANAPDLKKLTSAEVVQLLQYHGASNYMPIGTLKVTSGPIGTFASSSAGRFELTATAEGGSVTLHTGVDSSRVAGTAVDSAPFVVFTIDNVLLPSELFGSVAAPTPAPGKAPVLSPFPVPVASPNPDKAPSPEQFSSPPAPLTNVPDTSPVEGPDPDPAVDNAGGYGKARALLKSLLSVSAVACFWAFS